jgi:hypothetical protein
MYLLHSINSEGHTFAECFRTGCNIQGQLKKQDYHRTCNVHNCRISAISLAGFVCTVNLIFRAFIVCLTAKLCCS